MDSLKRRAKIAEILEINSLLKPGSWTDQAIDAFLLGYELGKMNQ